MFAAPPPSCWGDGRDEAREVAAKCEFARIGAGTPRFTRPVKLGEVREIVSSITVRNGSKSPVTLKFPTTQILEISLRDVVTGTVVSKWSTDRTFSDSRRIIAINAGERLEYSEPITTRELKAGKIYNLEVVFLGYENQLFAKKVIIPQP